MTDQYVLDLLATAVFAMTGALVARNQYIDIYGVVVFGFSTAVGGGTVRDLLLGRVPVFWVEDTNYVMVAVVASIVTFAIARTRDLPSQALVIADALSLALFTLIGAEIALSEHHNAIVAVIAAILTGTGGGMIRDLLAGKVPLVLQSEIYATASMVGAIVYIGWGETWTSSWIRDVVCMTVIVMLRFWSIYYGGKLPLFLNEQ